MGNKKEDNELSVIASAMAASMSKSTLNEQLNNSTFALVTPLKPIYGACLLSSLFYAPEFQSNVLQIEGLVHLLLAKGGGKKKLHSRTISKLFKGTKGTSFEYNMDPAEDFMTSVVYYENRKFRILEGIYEGNSFCLQRILSTLEVTPDTEFTIQIKSSVRALLKISDCIFSLTDLNDYVVGQSLPLRNIKNSTVKEARNYGAKLLVTIDKLKSLGINLESLAPFVFDLNNRDTLADSILGESPLEQRPLLLEGKKFHLILPTAVGVAIRSYFISKCIQNNLLTSLTETFQFSYIQYFSSEIPILGELTNLKFSPIPNNEGLNVGAEVIVSIDPGRYLHIVIQFDDFAGFEPNYIDSSSPNIEAIGSTIDNHINKVSTYIQSREDFKQGISLVVLAGWGRLEMGFSTVANSKEWRREYVSAHDLETFSNLGDISPLKFWRFVEAIQTIEESGINIFNINGLLNLYGHLKSNNFQALHNNSFSDDDFDTSNFDGLSIMIGTNFVRDVRIESNRASANQLVKNPSGDNIQIARRNKTPLFKEDKEAEIYASLTDLKKGQLVGFVKGKLANWWLQPEVSDEHGKDFVFKIWEANCHWVKRIDNTLHKIGNISLPSNIVWKWNLADFDFATEVQAHQVPSSDELSKMIESDSESSETSITILTELQKGYVFGYHQESNDAERIFASSFLESLVFSTSFSTEQLDVLPNIKKELFNSPDIKHIHMFVAQSFRDYVSNSLPSPVLADEVDEAIIKMGLGWLARESNQENEIFGKTACTDYLRELVHQIWLKIKNILQSCNKDDVVTKLLLNHEAIQCDAKRWRRTIKANLAGHVDKQDVIDVVSKQLRATNSGSISTRIIIEMAICECSKDSGEKIGRLDISRLCTYASLLFHLGNSSDAIHYDILPDHIKIAPLGDVLFEQEFSENIIDPYGNRIQTKLLEDDFGKYSKNFTIPSTVVDISSVLRGQFIEAWYQEYDIGINDLRRIIDAFEDDGIKQKSAIVKYSREEIDSLCRKLGVNKCYTEGLLKHFVLQARQHWTDVPKGLEHFHIMPWRFKRELSLYRRPIIFYNDKYVVAPEMLREGFSHFLYSCYEGSIPADRFNTQIMRSWVGAARKEKGFKFNTKVKLKLEELGWKALSEKKLDDLLNRKLDRDYGDIDVVAWNKSKTGLLLIECKSLEFAKTEGEIARQISEFRGLLKHNGEPDRLLKHIERINTLLRHSEDLLKRFGMNADKVSITPCLIFSEIVPVSHMINENRMLADSGIQVFEFDDIEVLTGKFC